VRPLDWCFLILSAALTVGTAGVAFIPSDAPPRVEIEDADGRAVYPLNEDRLISAKGPLGITTVHIQGGGVHIEDSPCTNKVCIAMGVIRSSGQFVACLPNRIFVRITGGSRSPEVPDAAVW
jgi:hypothetical protein